VFVFILVSFMVRVLGPSAGGAGRAATSRSTAESRRCGFERREPAAHAPFPRAASARAHRRDRPSEAAYATIATRRAA
jgi:hypothetical protein